ncbi:MAG: copper resistance protein CopC [Anaerolineae bacterium]|nr:copper resistance protein CopC [Anaerolineae bacterium]
MRAGIGIGVVSIFCLFIWTAVTYAHAELLTAVPAPGSVMTNSPAEIRLTFSEPISEDSTILLFTENFQPVTGIVAQVADANPQMLMITVPTLTPGDYTVQWTAVSTDGHPTSGSYSFRLARFALPPTLLWQISLTLLFLGAFVILWRWNRKL